MSKDRYSDDHTIEVVGGTNTVVLKDNVSVDQDITAGNDITANGVLSADQIDSASGSGITVVDDVEVSGTAQVDNLTVTTDAEVTGTLTINDFMGSSGEALKVLTRNVTIGGTLFAGDVNVVDLTSAGFDSSTEIFSINATVEAPSAGDIYSEGYNGSAGDFRFGFRYDKSSQILRLNMYGASWSGSGETNVVCRVVIWYK